VSFLLFPSVHIYDERYGPTGLEPLGQDLEFEALGVEVLPGLFGVEQQFADLLEASSFTANLGATRARLNASVSRVPVGASVGVFDWLTLGAVAPFVKRVVEVDFLADPTTANLGASPGGSDALVATFLAEARASLESVRTAVEATCASAGEQDSACLDGRAFVDGSDAFLSELQQSYGGAFFILGGTDQATTLSARVATLKQQMRQRGDSILVDSTFVTPVPFADSGVGLESLEPLFTDGANGIAGQAPGPLRSVWELGDVELFAALRLLSREPDDAHSEANAPALGAPMGDSTATSSLGYLVGVQATYRLGTGVRAAADNPFDLGSGDGLDDVEVRVFGRLDVGTRLRARAEYIHGIQLSGDRTERVALITAPWGLVMSEALRTVDPGDYRSVLLAPELRLTPEISIGGRYVSYHRSPDRYDRATATDADADALEAGSEVDLKRWGVGVSLWPSNRTRLRNQWPVALSADYLRAFDGQGRFVPAGGEVRIQLRVFFKAW